MYGKMQASGLMESIPFICTSAIWGQSCSLFTFLLALFQLLSNHYGEEGGNIFWIAVWGALIHIWRPEIADGCDIVCLLIWQDIFSFHNLPVVINLTIFGRHFMTFFFFNPHGTGRLISDQVKVLINKSLQALISDLGPLINNKIFSGSSIF